MKNIPDKSIDLIFTDPPYNISGGSKLTIVGDLAYSNSEVWGNKFDDNIPEEKFIKLVDELSILYYRILKDNGSIITFFDRNKPYLLKPFYEKFKIRNMFAFVKTSPVWHVRKNNYRSGFELAAWFSKEKYKFNFLSQKEMINVFYGMSSGSKVTEHPTEKYFWMIDPIIERHTNPGDIILDPFCGSGTICLSALKQERKYCGVEISSEYVNMSLKRIAEYENFMPKQPLDCW